MKKIIKYSFSYIALGLAGFFFALAFVKLYILPSAVDYIHTDPKLIKLAGHESPQPYNDIIKRRYLAELYYKHPYYTFKKNKGLKILEDLAYEGYSPAAYELDFMYSHGFYNIEENQKEAYKWTMLTVEQGGIDLLARMFDVSFNSYEKRIAGGNEAKDLKTLEQMTMKHHSHWPAKVLADYYHRMHQPEKSDYWFEIAKERYFSDDEDEPMPTCNWTIDVTDL